MIIQYVDASRGAKDTHRGISTNAEFDEARDLKLGPFSPAEDEIIFQYGEAQGGKNVNWRNILEQLPGRTTKETRERYYNVLHPSVRTAEFSDYEDYLLFLKVRTLGTQWEQLKNFFSGRSAIELRNRWFVLCNRRNLSNYPTTRNSVQPIQLAQLAVQPAHAQLVEPANNIDLYPGSTPASDVMGYDYAFHPYSEAY
ncbi:MAG: hypothetical protein LBR89_03905 [Holosporales bacterium]|jgi:hypothetical protein|nr:hypothetical protein [Holosporales bacterium]